MPTKLPRLNVVLENPVYFALVKLAKRDRVSLSLKARDLITQALEYTEDLAWNQKAGQREKTFSAKKALSHKQVWG